MNFKTKFLAVLLVVSVFLLSSCEVYQTLYGTTGQVVVLTENKTMEKEMPQEPEEKPEEKPEVMEPKPKEKPVVIVVQETDLVNLVPKAEDPDKDTLVFTFTSPINENGVWQTTYGDAGEYTITVTVSDGELTATKDVLIIVNKKEETPTIDSSKPIETSLVIDEGQSIDFSVTASDLNNDPLTYLWKFDGFDVATGTEYTYQSDFDSAGSHTVKVDVSDGLSSASKIWSVEVRNVNRMPVLEDLQDINVKETDKVTITALGTDDDKDSLSYSIDDNRFAQEDNIFTWETDYESAGTYEVTVIVTDGIDTTRDTFAINVENVNRPPVIVDVLQNP